MEKKRELTCSNLHDIMDELLNVCISTEDYMEASCLVSAYNDIRRNSDICVDGNKDYLPLVLVGGNDGREYVEDGVIHNNGTDWEVFPYYEHLRISDRGMKVCLPEDYDYPSIQQYKFYDVYITVGEHRVVIPYIE